METNEKNQMQGNIDLSCFDLGEENGGKQLILQHVSISSTEHYVFTIGDGPKDKTFNENDNNTKIRCFKLTKATNGQYAVKEYVTPEEISKIAELFDFWLILVNNILEGDIT